MAEPTPPATSDVTPDSAGRMAGEYRLGRKLGEGGFGAAYEAEHPLLKRRAAVKVLHRVAMVRVERRVFERRVFLRCAHYQCECSHRSPAPEISSFDLGGFVGKTALQFGHF